MKNNTISTDANASDSNISSAGKTLKGFFTAAEKKIESVKQGILSLLNKNGNAALFEEKVYKYYTFCDDRMEKPRQLMSEALEFRRNAELISEKAYQISSDCDEVLEKFRQNVSEILTEVSYFTDLVAHRIRQEVLRGLGRKRTYGTIAVDRKFEHKAQHVFEHLRDGILGDIIEALEECRRKVLLKLDVIAEKGHKITKRVEKHIDAVINRFMENRKRYSMTITAVAGCFLMFCVTVNAGTVYNYYYHGTELGTVKNKAEVEAAVTQVQEGVSEELNVEVAVNAEPDVDITYEKQFSFSAVVDSADEVANKLVSSEELEGNGFAISVNGTVAALVDTEETAEKLVLAVKEKYCTVNPETAAQSIAEVMSAEAVENTAADGTAQAAGDMDAYATAAGTAPAAETENTEEADAETTATAEVDAAVIRKIILDESMNKKTGIVTAAAEADETVVNITAESPAQVDYSVIDFSKVDPSLLEGIFIDNVFINDTVTIEPVTAKVSEFRTYENALPLFVDEETGKSKIFSVSTAEIDVYTEPVPFVTVYEETDSLYEGETEVKSEGTEGEVQIVASVIKDNELEVSREIINETVILEPVEQIVLKGTKEKPSWVATGNFITPANGRFTSGYGRRWGRLHGGIDIAGPVGTPIYASDGGTVIYAGYNTSGYGNLVKIDHGNGFMTFYAHNSQLLVSAGDKVYQGQVIAKMGNTGRSTGPHCHFEIHKNGTRVNPSSYL